LPARRTLAREKAASERQISSEDFTIAAAMRMVSGTKTPEIWWFCNFGMDGAYDGIPKAVSIEAGPF